MALWDILAHSHGSQTNMLLQGYILINPLQLYNHRQSSIHEHFKQTQNICKESELEGKILLPDNKLFKWETC